MEVIFDKNPITIEKFKRTKYYDCDVCRIKPDYLYELSCGGGYEYEPPNLCLNCLKNLIKKLHNFLENE